MSRDLSAHSQTPRMGLNISHGYGSLQRGVMSLQKLAAALLFLAATWCPGQIKYNVGPGVLRDLLRKGNTSGSVVYADKCDSLGLFPVPPNFHFPRNTGTTVEVLRDMFSGDSRMKVTQDSKGIIRMVEKDIPTDILEVRIHHITFDASHSPMPNLFHGPNMALMTILSSPEVRSFQKEHNIIPNLPVLEGNLGQSLPAATGELDDVSVSEALDYLLKLFPGYWVYENCTVADGSRAVSFGFY